jgi:NADH-quinone oxidoreductase subunit E
MTSLDPGAILEIIDKRNGAQGSIIAILEDIQASYNYLPREALQIVAKRTGHSLVDLYGVATFYTSFSLEPRGEHLVSVCLGTACHVRGAPQILEAFEDNLRVAAGETTEDRSFTLTTVNCLGACALGPVAVMDGEYCRNVKKSQVPSMVRACRCGSLTNHSDPEEALGLHAVCPRCNRSLMVPDHTLDGHPMIHVTASFGRKHGWIRLSSILDDHRIQSEHEIPDNTLVDFFCPRCHAELRSPKLCPLCDAPMIPLLNRKGGMITLCSRRGCQEQTLDLL